VHLITGGMNEHSGISRSCQELYNRLRGNLPVQLCSFRSPPLAGHLSFLQHLPLGVEPDDGAGVYHFTRIMGCSLMLWRPVRPAVATVHDLGPLICPAERHERNQLDWWVYKLSLLGLKRVDRVIADSMHTADGVVSLLGLPRERVTVIPLGVNQSLFRKEHGAREALEKRYDIPDRPGVANVLYVGSEAPRKNLGTLLRALAMLRNAGIPARLIKVGAPGRPTYRTATLGEARRLGLEDALVLANDVPDIDLAIFYSAADVFVLASLVEGFGLPVLEAMACGTPVVSSSAGCLPEVAEGAALMADPADVCGLSECIAHLLGDAQLRERLVQRGLERVRKFNWVETAERTQEVYRQLLAQA